MGAGNPTSFQVSLLARLQTPAYLVDAAIRFVLADQYTSLTREERQRLLHEGTSTTTTLSAYVEIVFDSE